MDEFENFPTTEKRGPKLGWNWGAFIMPVQFALGNGAYLALLVLVPVINLIWCFVAGSQAAQWAYESGKFANVDEFNGAMESWNRAGKITAIICLAFIALYILLGAALIGSITAIFSNLAF